MKIISVLVLLSLASISSATPRNWKSATVAEITSSDEEISMPRTTMVKRPGCQGGIGCYESVPAQSIIILTSTILIRFETPDISYIVRQIIRNNGHPLNVTLNGQAQISVDGKDLHILNDEGKDVKLPIVRKIAKMER